MRKIKKNHLWEISDGQSLAILFGSATCLMKAAEKYFAWCDEHMWYSKEPVKSGTGMGTIIDVPVARPYTLSGLCVYLGCSQRYFMEMKKKCSPELLLTLERIEDIIETQQFEGAVVGVFNASVITKKNSWKDMVDTSLASDSVFKIEVVNTETKEELIKLDKMLNA